MRPKEIRRSDNRPSIGGKSQISSSSLVHHFRILPIDHPIQQRGLIRSPWHERPYSRFRLYFDGVLRGEYTLLFSLNPSQDRIHRTFHLYIKCLQHVLAVKIPVYRTDLTGCVPGRCTVGQFRVCKRRVDLKGSFAESNSAGWLVAEETMQADGYNHSAGR